MTISEFAIKHFKHFNAATIVDASRAYLKQLEEGHSMMITLAGAMSTAELGISLAEMIRRENVQIICCTGANLEEDLFNLVAHNHYKRISNYRDLSPEDEKELLDNNLNRVTDTCIPEHEAMRMLENKLITVWKRAQQNNERYFPHEFIYQIIEEFLQEDEFQIDPKNSWVLAAYEKKMPIIVPGWEDSTTGNMFAAHCIEGQFEPTLVKSGIEYMMYLAKWYLANAHYRGVGFFQIGGGIAGDFPICTVPMLHQDMGIQGVHCWSYFCQISDSTTSYGSYSGAHPNEKITWGKLEVDTPKFIIESDASIVAPLMFQLILENQI